MNAALNLSRNDFEVVLVEKEDKLVLTGDVNFAYNKSDLTPQATMTLDNFIRQISNPAFVKLEIVGHTDSRGSDDYNQGLSERRAMSVAEYFRDKGRHVLLDTLDTSELQIARLCSSL